MKKVKVGLIGFGTVGSGVVKILKERRVMLRQKAGVDIELAVVCDKDLVSRRNVKISKKMITRKADRVINDPGISIVVELVGGVHPAKKIIKNAITAGKHVVTANKHLLAETGGELFSLARRKGVELQFEASVAGGIPVIRTLRDGLISNRIDKLFGIVNGTCNFILSRMTEMGWEFKTALSEAQRRGYAERNPALDISGMDSAHKLAILASLGFGRNVKLKDIYVEGIERITYGDILYAGDLGYRIKLLAIAKREADALSVRVHPTLLPDEHVLSQVNGADNAIFIKGDLVGEILLAGRGAGQMPTASAVVSDIVDIACGLKQGKFKPSPSLMDGWSGGKIRKMKKMREVETRFYMRFMAFDRPGVLAKISKVLGQHRISISASVQKERRRARVVPIVLMTHEANENSLQNALKKIDRLAVVSGKSVAIRVEAA